MQPIIDVLLDPVVNFGKVTVLGGYDHEETSVMLTTGGGSKLPNPVNDGSFNLVWFDSSTYYDPADDPKVEIVRCIARVENTLTLMRGQEGTSASTKNTPGKTYKMVLAPTKKIIDDIGIESQSKVNTHSALSTGVHGIGVDTIDGVGARNIAISAHSLVASNVHGVGASGFEDKANRNVMSGYAGLDANARVPTAQLGSDTADDTTFLRGDQTWATPPGGGAGQTPTNLLAPLTPTFSGWATNPDTLANITDETYNRLTTRGTIPSGTFCTIDYDLGSVKTVIAWLFAITFNNVFVSFEASQVGGEDWGLIGTGNVGIMPANATPITGPVKTRYLRATFYQSTGSNVEFIALGMRAYEFKA